MSLVTALTLAGFSTLAHAESPFINPVSLSGFSEWNLSDKAGSVGSVDIDGSVEVTLYTNAAGAPTLKTFITTDATEKGDRGDLAQLVPGSSLIVVTEDFAKQNKLDIKVTNKRLIPVPDDFKVGGEIKYVNIPSINVGGMVLNDVTALISGSEKGINGRAVKGITIGLGTIPTSYAVLNSKGVIKFSDDGAGLMNEIGAKSVPYQSTEFLVGTVGKKDLFGTNKQIVQAFPLVVDASFSGSQTVSVALTFDQQSSSLDKYIDATSGISAYKADLRKDWMNIKIGEITTPETYVARSTIPTFVDGLLPIGSIGQGVLIGYDIVVDKTSETIGMVQHDGFSFTPYYPIHLEEAYKALESVEGEESTEESEESLNIGGIKALIEALETGGSYSESLEQYSQLLADEEEKTDCAIWLKYGHANRKLGDLEEARKAYLESSRLYHSWWDIDLGRRMDINKAQTDMKEEDIDAAKERSSGAAINSVENGWYISQPESCYRADGWVASVDLLNGNHDAVEDNYRNNLDLDAGLAQILGNSALVQGNTELAHEAFRQAVKLENGVKERAENRHALAMVYADQGKWEQANELFQESLELDDNPIVALLWADNMAAQFGQTQAAEVLQQWSVEHPADQSGPLALLRLNTPKVASSSSTNTSTNDGILSEGDTLQIDSEDGFDILGVDLNDVDSEIENTDLLGFDGTTIDDTIEETQFDVTLNDDINTSASVSDSLSIEMPTNAEWLEPTLRVKYDDPENHYATKILAYTYMGDLPAAGDLIKTIEGQLNSSATLSFAAANYYASSGMMNEAYAALRQATVLRPQLTGYALTLR